MPDRNGKIFYTSITSLSHISKDAGSVELGISHILEHMERDHFSYEYAFFIGLTVRREDFLSGILKSDTLCLYVDRSYVGKRNIQIQPQGTYASIYFDDYNRIGEYMGKLRQFCRDKHCTIAGDMICRWIGTMNLERFINHKEFLRLQVPVIVQEEQNINV